MKLANFQATKAITERLIEKADTTGFFITQLLSILAATLKRSENRKNRVPTRKIKQKLPIL